jgi:two-component system, OmpR family, response regulator
MKRALVFLVQDSATLSLQLQRWLHSLGYEVILADCNELEDACNPAPALVCVEVWGVEGNGFKVVRQLAEHYQGPRLLLTGSGRSSDQAWAQRVGASAVLARPFSCEQLASCIGGLA